MLVDTGFLLVGGLLIYFGAGWLVRGAVGLALRFRVRPLVVGLTVVAYGTSAPELVVGVGSALTGHGDIAFGNAVGSNIANIGLILGMTALIKPPNVDPSLMRREVPVMVLSALAVPVLLVDGHLTRWEGAGLLLCALVYTVVMIRSARADAGKSAAEVEEVAEAAGDATDSSTAKLVAINLAGLALLLLGGRWFVTGASGVALGLGIPERLVGLTVVAIGTSLPELATCLVAAHKGHSDLAVGNVIGSNIFNVLLILGASGVAGSLDVTLSEARLDLLALGVMTVLATVAFRRQRRVTRLEGATLLLFYVGFLVALLLVQSG
jgi:cation:H+ antiporter